MVCIERGLTADGADISDGLEAFHYPYYPRNRRLKILGFFLTADFADRTDGRRVLFLKPSAPSA
jgi:hypothetical protein